MLAIVGLGAIWMAVGIIQARVARDEHCDLGSFYAIGCALVAVLCTAVAAVSSAGVSPHCRHCHRMLGLAHR